MREWADTLALLKAVSFRADAHSLETVLEGAHAPALLGHPAEVPLSVSTFWNAVVPAEERAGVIEMLRSVAADGVARSMEHSAIVPGRAQVCLQTVAQIAETPNAPRALAGVILDVTAARASERQSQDVEAWLATLSESLPFDFEICDRLGRLVLQNPASRHRRGTRAADFDEQWRRCIDRALAGAQVREELIAVVEGEERIYTRIVSPVRHSSREEPTGALAVIIDVTDLKRAEQRLRVSLDQLRQTQGELVHRERLAVLGEMAAAVAHEVRNPLGAMFNAVEVLRRAPPRSDDERQLLEIILDELRRLDVLVVNLFDLVRPLGAVLQPQSLTSVVEESLAHALRGAPEPSLVRVVRRAIDPSLEVSMDRPLLGLALVNILRNALQAMPDGGELGLELERNETGGKSWARIAIHDTGGGIGPEVRARMFEPFFTTRPTGSGLGLAIVKRVIDEHRGELEVSTEPGHGTSFVVRLPYSPLRPSNR